ncbi:bifunctional serine/threonine-protein kinase/ABC transporter substrate-binding protein [Streptomyces sp. NPDC056716]|uniref:bifunctional serine/threonine-protein kinase/ABC transporter substrate-binding protein n=1 Tax=unclassified Streptomyces TaxID=2593676 RepID=UPI0036BAEB2E
MRALRPEDPETLGGHRLLARLGTGGMGTVYLARAADGAPVALKVIRAEYAADPAFRARFRREVRLAGGLSGRWVVPVTAADTEAAAPWLATAFVAGPSLAEAVSGAGALPGRTVAVLGARLARALAEVHAAGLVHRDVKPGNILLALDGPRLIDFGIAQGAGVTALTAPDAVIGTPGYLAPEQARASAGEVAAPSDVFALGCVLAYAATGRRPFGTGDPSAVLYRTVHEEPDLVGLDAVLTQELAAVVTACLRKAPWERPTAAQLGEVCERAAGERAAGGWPAVDWGAGGGSYGPADRSYGPVDGALGPADGSYGPPEDGDGARSGSGSPAWLPPEVVRLVADRSARALDPPPRPVAAMPEVLPDDTRDRPTTRRRALLIGGSALAVVAASGAAAAVLLVRRDPSTQGAAPQVPTRTLAFQGDLSGAQKDIGTAQERAARLAVADHNARADITFRLALSVHDDGGDTGRAATLARTLADDPEVRAVIGPTGAGTAKAAAPLYQAASMPFVLVSADPDEAGLSPATTRNLVVTRAPGSYRTLPLISYLTRVHDSRRTAVVEDGDGGAMARDASQNFRDTVPNGDDGGTVSVHQVAAGEDDFGPAVREVLAADAQAVVYAGTSAVRAAACARALTEAGFPGACVGFEAVMRQEFLDAAGGAADGWVFGASFTEVLSVDTGAARAFTAAYRERYGAPPGRWAVEAYDAVGLLGRTLDAFGSRASVEPGEVAERVFVTSYEGVAKPLGFTKDGERLLQLERSAFLYRAEGGQFHFLGRFDQVTADSA